MLGRTVLHMLRKVAATAPVPAPLPSPKPLTPPKPVATLPPGPAGPALPSRWPGFNVDRVGDFSARPGRANGAERPNFLNVPPSPDTGFSGAGKMIDRLKTPVPATYLRSKGPGMLSGPPLLQRHLEDAPAQGVSPEDLEMIAKVAPPGSSHSPTDQIERSAYNLDSGVSRFPTNRRDIALHESAHNFDKRLQVNTQGELNRHMDLSTRFPVEFEMPAMVAEMQEQIRQGRNPSSYWPVVPGSAKARAEANTAGAAAVRAANAPPDTRSMWEKLRGVEAPAAPVTDADRRADAFLQRVQPKPTPEPEATDHVGRARQAVLGRSDVWDDREPTGVIDAIQQHGPVADGTPQDFSRLNDWMQSLRSDGANGTELGRRYRDWVSQQYGAEHPSIQAPAVEP